MTFFFKKQKTEIFAVRAVEIFLQTHFQQNKLSIKNTIAKAETTS